MATYYLSPNTGADANAGTGPNAAWQHWSHALGTITAGDTMYVAGGTALESNLTFTNAGTSGSPITIIGDPTGGHFLAGGFTGTLASIQGPVVLDPHVTDGITLPTTTTITLKSWTTLQYLIIFAGHGTAAAVDAMSNTCVGINLLDCHIVANSNQDGVVGFRTTPNTNMQCAVKRCSFVGINSPIYVNVMQNSATADYNVGLTFDNCTFEGIYAEVYPDNSASTFKGGGVSWTHCHWRNCANCIETRTGIATSAGNQCSIRNSVLWQAPVWMDTAGQIIDSNNVIHGIASSGGGTTFTPDASDVIDGTGGIIKWPYAFHCGQDRFTLQPPHLPFSPMQLPGNPFLGAGSNTYAPSPNVDMLNLARPVGGVATTVTVGPYERHDTMTRATTPVQAGTYSGELGPGPADQRFTVLVKGGTSVTFAIYVQYDGSYTGTNYPQMIVLAQADTTPSGPYTATATSAASGAWQQISVAFTPSNDGEVTVQLLSRDGGTTGHVYFDTFSAT